MQLTDLSIKALKAPAKGAVIYTDSTIPGFGVRVSEGGTKSFVLTRGKLRKRETLGRVGIVLLKDARQEAKRRLAAYTLGKPIFTYGDTIFNPYNRTITKDLEGHEAVHGRQQGSSSDAWWYRYLHDPVFRLSQEIEAYGAQFALVKPLLHGKLRDWVLDSMAGALSGPMYGNAISHNEARSKIRHYSN